MVTAAGAADPIHGAPSAIPACPLDFYAGRGSNPLRKSGEEVK